RRRLADRARRIELARARAVAQAVLAARRHARVGALAVGVGARRDRRAGPCNGEVALLARAAAARLAADAVGAEGARALRVAAARLPGGLLADAARRTGEAGLAVARHRAGRAAGSDRRV